MPTFVRVICLLSGLIAAPAVQAQDVPLADHHQHLFGPAVIALLAPPPPAEAPPPLTAKELIALLDKAGIRRAVILSVAYFFGSPNRSFADEYDRVKAENDWTSQQVALYPDRLIAFCGLNPLRDYALAEIARCAKDPHVRHGLKLHFGNSEVDVHNPQHVEQMRRVFRAANDNRMAVTVHMHASINKKMPYGRDEARIFLEEILPAAPDVVVQIAHLAGAGNYTPAVDDALGVFAEAIGRNDPRTRLLYVDANVVLPALSTDQARRIAERLRQVGLERVLFGSDGALGGNLPPQENWAAFQTALPLTAAEQRAIANNVPPYLRSTP